MSFSVMIVDDEPLARKRIRALLEANFPDVEIIGEAGSGALAIQQIKELLPDVIFLDIQMPDMDGFDVLHGLTPDEVPLVVFTTAYENFAAKAFEEDTVDYLLKPVEPERLASAIEKIKRRLPAVPETTEPEISQGVSWSKLRDFVDANNPYLQRLQIKIGDRIVFVNMDEVVRFQSHEKYTVVYTVNNQYITYTGLVDLEKRLDPKSFVRIHRSHIVAIDYIAECKRTDAGRMVMRLRDKEGTLLLVSRSYAKTIKSL